MVAPSRWRSALRFRLRTLLAFLTLCCLGSGGFLLWWRAPFTLERMTTESGWEHGDSLKASLPPAGQIAFLERSRVYRDAHGEYVKDGPTEIFDSRGRRLRLEHWSHGKLHGPWFDWDMAGKEIARGEYIQGLKHGLWIVSKPRRPTTQIKFEQGIAREEDVFLGSFRIHKRRNDKGELLELSRWDAFRNTEALTERVRHSARDGARWDDVERWYLDGRKKLVGKKRNGLEIGEWTIWNADGSFAHNVEFHDGCLVLKNGRSAPPILPQPPESDSAAEVRIREALDDTTSIEFISTPLTDVVAYLEDAHEIPILLYCKKLSEAGCSSSKPITMALEGFSLRAALQVMLHEQGLAPVVRRQVLLITTLDDAAAWRDETGLPEILAGTNAELVQSLQGVANCKFKETPLKEVLSHFRNQESIPIRFKESAFVGRSRLLDEPVTLPLRGVSRVTALGFVLDDHELSCTELDGEMWVKPRPKP
jgi:hypothetical protein